MPKFTSSAGDFARVENLYLVQSSLVGKRVMEEDVAPGRMASVRPVHFVIESGYRDLTNTLDRVVQGGGNASNFEYMIYVYSNCRVKPQGDAHNILSKPHGSRNIS